MSIFPDNTENTTTFPIRSNLRVRQSIFSITFPKKTLLLDIKISDPVHLGRCDVGGTGSRVGMDKKT